jgi:replicative DNA helicase
MNNTPDKTPQLKPVEALGAPTAINLSSAPAKPVEATPTPSTESVAMPSSSPEIAALMAEMPPVLDETLSLIERGLLGAIQLDPVYAMGCCEARGVEEDWFTLKKARTAWKLFVQNWRENIIPDATYVADQSSDEEMLPWLMQCVEIAQSSTIAPAYVERLAKARLKRQLISALQQVRIDASQIDVHEAIHRARVAIDQLCSTEESTYGGMKKATAFTETALREVETLYQKRVVEGDKKYYNGLSTPWSVLNRLYAGLRAGVHIIAARPSQGKTALAVTMCLGMAHEKVPQLFFSLDMGQQKLVERYGSLLGQVSLARLNYEPAKEDIPRFKDGLERIPDNIYVSNAHRIDRILGEIHCAVKYKGVKCVWIDYLQIVSGEKEYYKSHKEEIDAVLSQLKQCAYALNIPIICLAQLNRESAKNPAARPSLIDIGDSGNIEREAATVLILWRDPLVRANWDRNPPLALAKNALSIALSIEPMWLLLTKNQQGATGDLPFIFYKNTFMFRPADHEAKPIEIRDRNGDLVTKDYTPLFSTVRDDYLIFTEKDGSGLDDYLYRAGTLGKRGL